MHLARRHIKSMRGLLRLAWPERDDRTGDVLALDRALKSLADHLAPARDDRVAARMADDLAARCNGDAKQWLDSFAKASHEVAARGERSRHGQARHRRAVAAIDARLAGLAWPRSSDDLASALVRWHRRARRRLEAALADGDAEALHAARTSVVRVLVQVEAMAGRAGGFARRQRGLDRLRSVLGEHHDLDLLARRIDADAVPATVRTAILKRIAARQMRLEREAARLHARWHGPAGTLERKLRRRLARSGAGAP